MALGGDYQLCVVASDELSNDREAACATLTLVAAGADALDIDDAVVSNRERTRTGGTLTCEAGNVFVLDAVLSQDGWRPRQGSARGNCTGEEQRYQLSVVTGTSRLPRQSLGDLVPGQAPGVPAKRRTPDAERFGAPLALLADLVLGTDEQSALLATAECPSRRARSGSAQRRAAPSR